VDHDVDVIRVVERRRGAIEDGIIEVPLRRGELPDQLVELARVLAVAEPASPRSFRVVKVQNWTTTTLPRRPAGVSG
jgi:hypothetical protein